MYADIRSETSGDYQHLLLGLFHTPAQYDALCLFNAMARLGTDDTTLIEILASRTNAEKLEIRRIFATEHKCELEHAVRKETSGDYEKCLLRLLQPRDESNVINIALAQESAARLWRAGEGRIGTDEKMFIDIMCSASFYQLKQIAAEYINFAKNKHHHTLRHAIDSEFSFHIKQSLKAILSVAEYGQVEYWAECAYNAMKGLGTADTRLIRVVLTCFHRNLIPPLKIAFQKKYGKSLHSWVSSETSFNYRKALLTIIGER